ncbi:MAG: hypothetical protein SGI73_21790 [Chloroflexota bacterium]|nr:hypothetical protein [Chloroflexota bacterium]
MRLAELHLDHQDEWAALLAAAFERDEADMRRLLYWLHEGGAVIAWGAWIEGRLVAQYSCLIRALYVPSLGATI